MDTDCKVASGLPLPSPDSPTPALSLDWTFAHAAFVWGLGEDGEQGRGRRGCGQLHRQQSCPTPSPQTGCPPAPAAALPTVAAAPQVCSLPPSPCPRGDGCLCASEVLLVGAPSVWMRPGFYQARVPCRDWGRTGSEHASPWELQGPCGRALQAGLGWCPHQQPGPGAQGGASWALGAVTWAVTSGAQRPQLEGPVGKHDIRVPAISGGIGKMEGDHDGDPREFSRPPAAFSSQTITVTATASRATRVADIMLPEAGTLFRLIFMPAPPQQVRYPRGPRLPAGTRAGAFFQPKVITPGGGGRLGTGLVPIASPAWRLSWSCGLGEVTRMHSQSVFASGCCVDSGPWATQPWGDSRETQPGHLTPPGPEEKPGL